MWHSMENMYEAEIKAMRVHSFSGPWPDTFFFFFRVSSSYVQLSVTKPRSRLWSHLEEASLRRRSVQRTGGNYVFGSLLRLATLAYCAVCQAPLLHGRFETSNPSTEAVQQGPMPAWYCRCSPSTPSPGSRMWWCKRVGSADSHSCFQEVASHALVDRPSGMEPSISCTVLL